MAIKRVLDLEFKFVTEVHKLHRFHLHKFKLALIWYRRHK